MREMTYYDTVTKFVDRAYEKHGTHAYAVGYLGSLVSNMVYEMKQREQYDMADYYQRQLTNTLKEMK